MTIKNTFRNAALATTALVAAGMLSGQAQAADPVKLQLGGYMEQWFGFADNDDPSTGKYTDWDSKQDSEVHFLGSTKLDNGIGVSVLVEMKTDGGNHTIDDAHMELASDTMGTLMLGQADGIAKATMILAPDVGIENTDGDYGNWIAAPTGFTDTGATFFNGSGGGNKVTYVSPTFAGFTAGVSYTPGGTASLAAQPNEATADTQQVWEGGFTYARDIGGVAFAMNAGYGYTGRTTAGDGLAAIQAGLSLGLGGFTVAGGYANLDGGNFSTTASSDGYAFDIGASYATGPYAVSLSWFRSEAEGDTATNGEDTKDSIMLSGAYNLGPGIDLKGSVFHVDYDAEVTTADNNNSGWAAVAGVAVTF